MIDRDFILNSIQSMLEGCAERNRNHLLVIAIKALVEAGIDTGPQIVGAAVSLGFRREHAGSILKHSEGNSPARHEWQRGADGVYRVHEDVKLAA